MSFWGIGPYFVFASIIITIILGYPSYLFRSKLTINLFPDVFVVLSCFFVIIGIFFWITAGVKIDSFIKKGVLADKGVYGIVRNPLYAGILFVLTGFFIYSRSALMIFNSFILYVLLRILLKNEDDILTNTFGDQYRIYKKNVNSIIPKIGSIYSAFFYPEPTGKISEKLFRIKNRDVNFFVYQEGNDFICIDAGYNDKKIIEELKNLQIDIDKIRAVFLTHTDIDHAGGINLFKNAEIYLSHDEESLINGKKKRYLNIYRNKSINKPHSFLEDNQVIEIGKIRIKAISTHGHTTGHTSYIIDDKILFTGDSVILQNGFIKTFYSIFNMNRKSAVDSTDKIKKLENIEIICTAHTGCGNFKDFLDLYQF